MMMFHSVIHRKMHLSSYAKTEASSEVGIEERERESYPGDKPQIKIDLKVGYNFKVGFLCYRQACGEVHLGNYPSKWVSSHSLMYHGGSA